MSLNRFTIKKFHNQSIYLFDIKNVSINFCIETVKGNIVWLIKTWELYLFLERESIYESNWFED
jgi:hypothetical protein